MTQETRKKITKWFWILITLPVLLPVIHDLAGLDVR